MKNIRIICEGYSDQRFLRDFLFLNYSIEITDKELKANKIIHRLGSGWTELKTKKTLIIEEWEDYTTLIFLDADDKNTKEKAGLEVSRKYVDELMKSWNWTKYDKYIFPNNENETGEVEDFLENIINTNNKDIFECWNGFETCLTQNKKNYFIPAKKSKIYLYHEVLLKEKYKDPERNFKNENLWDFEKDENSKYKNPYLQNLKQFLDPYLT